MDVGRRKIGAEKLRMVITEKELIEMEDVIGINFVNSTNFIDQIKSLELPDKVVGKKEFRALIIK